MPACPEPFTPPASVCPALPAGGALRLLNAQTRRILTISDPAAMLDGVPQGLRGLRWRAGRCDQVPRMQREAQVHAGGLAGLMPCTWPVMRPHWIKIGAYWLVEGLGLS